MADNLQKQTYEEKRMRKLEKKTTVYIVGMGLGNPALLTHEAVEALQKSTVCIGAARMLEIWDNSMKNADNSQEMTQYSAYKPEEIVEIITCHKGETIAVLFSGDIGFYSGAKKLYALLQRETEARSMEVRMLPGISSILYLLDKQGLTWEDVQLVSNHGTTATIFTKLLRHRKVATLLGDASQLSAICKRLVEVGMETTTVMVGERLSYPEETILRGTAQDFCETKTQALAVAYFEYTDVNAGRIAPGIPDEAFLRGTVPMTKAEVRAVVIAKLGIFSCVGERETPIVYDIGAGTGSVSVELSLLLEEGSVYAIEKNPEAVRLLTENRRRFHAGNMEIVEGEATQCIPMLPTPTHAFIGGSSGNLLQIIQQLYEKNPKIRIVVTAVTLETQAKLAELAARAEAHGMSFALIQMAVTRSKKAGSYHLQQAENPVWIATMEPKV